MTTAQMIEGFRRLPDPEFYIQNDISVKVDDLVLLYSITEHEGKKYWEFLGGVPS